MTAVKKIKETPRSLDMRDKLKELVDYEITRLPELLNELKGKDRLNAIMKLLPLVVPKTASVRYDANEPIDWGIR